MKKTLIITICLMLIFVLVACGTAKPNSPTATPDNNSPSVNPNDNTPGTTPAPQKVTVRQKNKGVKALSDAFDNLESLDEIVGVDMSAFDAYAATSSDDSDDNNEEELEGFIDITNPDEAYYQKSITSSIYYQFLNKYFEENAMFYETAKSNKNDVLRNDNLLYLNVWYDAGNGMIQRVTFDEENDDLICEFKVEDLCYSKFNVGRNKDDKLYYNFFYCEYDDVPLYNNINCQISVQYLEDSYYKSSKISKIEADTFYQDFPTYKVGLDFYEIDLSEDNNVLYWYSYGENYERESLKRCYDDRPLADGETISDIGYFRCFWINNDSLISYTIDQKSRSFGICSDNGLDIFSVGYLNEGEEGAKYNATLNLYEVSGVKKIMYNAKELLNYIEFENGQKFAELYYPIINEETKCSIYGSEFNNVYFPLIYFFELHNTEELLSRMAIYGIAFESSEYEEYLCIIDNPAYKFRDYSIVEDYDKICEYFSFEENVFDLESVGKDYDNVKDIMIPIEVNITVSIEGQATVEDGVIDLSDLKLVVENVEELTEKYLNGGEICLNDNVIGTLVYDYDEKTLSVDADTVEFDLAWLNVGGENVLAIRLPKLSVVLEIPYEGIFPEIEIPDEPTDETGNEPGDELGDETGDDNGDEQGTENGDENGNPDLNAGDENGGEPNDAGNENGNEPTVSNGDEDPAGTDDEDAD